MGEHRESIAGIGKTRCDPSQMSLKQRLDALSVTVVGNCLGAQDCLLAEHACDLISHHNIFVDVGAAFLWILAPVFLSRNMDLISQSHAFHFFKTDMY